jgi:hypothetical protein
LLLLLLLPLLPIMVLLLLPAVVAAWPECAGIAEEAVGEGTGG